MRLRFGGYVVGLVVRPAPVVPRNVAEFRELSPVAKLIAGFCPFCGYRVVGVEQLDNGSLRWSCFEGCNP